MANIWGSKDFLLPLFAIGLGSTIYKHEKKIINYINVIYTIFASYGILQIFSFQCGLFEQILPWDALYISNLAEHNFYQGNLLRYFGTMDMNTQYQVLVPFLLMFIWLNKSIIKNLKLLYVNTLLGLGFLTFSLERSPILMSLIFFSIWKFKAVITDWKKIAFTSLIVLFVLFNFNSLSSNLANKELTSEAWVRLSNAIYLNFNNDAAVQARQSEKWKPSIQIIKDHPLGIGLADVSPAANGKYTEYINFNNCHNNYLSYLVAYGYFGGIFIIGLLILLLYDLKKLPSKYRYFGYGLTVSYFCMAFFINIFIDRQGMLFFLLVGYLFSIMGTKKLTIKW
ncbi:MAG: O-antigen ligase family protein [Syntrophomonas sp.]